MNDIINARITLADGGNGGVEQVELVRDWRQDLGDMAEVLGTPAPINALRLLSSANYRGLHGEIVDSGFVRDHAGAIHRIEAVLIRQDQIHLAPILMDMGYQVAWSRNA